MTIWCSLYCKGNEAVGYLDLTTAAGETIEIPCCRECADKVLTAQARRGLSHPELPLDFTGEQE